MLHIYKLYEDGLSDVVECQDTPEWAEYCAKWAADGQCTVNPLLMGTNCARTCNLCQSRTSTPPVSHNFSTSQHDTSLPADAYDGINATATLNHFASSAVSTKSSDNDVSKNSLLTSVLSVGNGSTPAVNTDSNMSTYSTFSSSQLNITTTPETTSSALLNLVISSVCPCNVTSLSLRGDDISVTQYVTSPIINTHLRHDSHSSVAHVTGSDRMAVVTDSSMTTARQVVTAAKVNDSVATSRHSRIVDQLLTSTSPPVQQSDTQLHSAVTSQDVVSRDDNAMTPVALFTADVSPTSAANNDADAEDDLSSSFNNTQNAAVDGSAAVSVTSQKDIISPADAEKVSRDSFAMSSSRDVASATSNRGTSKTVVDSVSGLMTSDDDVSRLRPHLTPALQQTHTSMYVSSRQTSVDRQSQSVSDVQLSAINLTTSSSISSITHSSSVHFTSSSKGTLDNADVTGVRDNSSSSITRTTLSTDATSTDSTLSVHSVVDNVTCLLYTSDAADE